MVVVVELLLGGDKNGCGDGIGLATTIGIDGDEWLIVGDDVVGGLGVTGNIAVGGKFGLVLVGGIMGDCCCEGGGVVGGVVLLFNIDLISGKITFSSVVLMLDVTGTDCDSGDVGSG